MDTITKTLVAHIEGTNLTNRRDLFNQSVIALVDYLAALLAARHEAKVIEMANYQTNQDLDYIDLQQIAKSSSEQQAFWYGYTSHYLDYDDAQANLAGHFSTVLFSALLAVAKPTDTLQDFLTAYVAGAELEGLIGKWINPSHRSQGWHPTATVGPIGAAVAIGRLRGFTGERLAQLISLGATQSSGMSFQYGTDGKPLHVGLAARNAVWSYELLENTSLETSVIPFNSDTGWLKIIANHTITEQDVNDVWLQPGQIISPGLWMKVHQYCSAGICGAAGTQDIYDRLIERFGASGDSIWSHVASMTIHFPPGNDKGLKYKNPKSGREGQFSIEYVLWQIFEYGCIRDELFHIESVPEEFTRALPKISRVNDLPPVPQDVRVTEIKVTLNTGEILVANIDNPKGSPATPFTIEDLTVKLLQGTTQNRIDELFEAFKKYKDMGSILHVIQQL